MIKMEQTITVGNYRLLKPVGRGSYAQVFLASDIHGNYYAAKVLPMSNVNQLASHLLETIIQSVAEHPNLVTAIDFEVTPSHFVIIMKWCNQGDLLSQLGKMPQMGRATQQFMLEIASGLQFLHTRMGVIHRDLKTDNILFHNGHALIADYGLARILNEEAYVHTKGHGAPFYMAPEMLRSNYFDSRIDVYSLGIIFVEMLMGRSIRQLIQGEDLPCRREDFPSGQLLALLPNDQARNLVHSMLQKNPNDRASIDSVVNYLKSCDVVTRKQQSLPSMYQPNQQQAFSNYPISSSQASTVATYSEQFETSRVKPYSRHRCPSFHPLELAVVRTFTCDECRDRLASQTAYVCIGCEYGLCMRCEDDMETRRLPGETLMTCDEEHPLYRYRRIYPANQYRCNKCLKSYDNRSSPSFHCKQCEWDICPECNQRFLEAVMLFKAVQDAGIVIYR